MNRMKLQKGGAGRLVLGGTLMLAALMFVDSSRVVAQAAPAQGAPRQSGTVKAVAEHDFVLTDAAGQDHAVTLSPATKLMIVPPGSKDLSAATAGAVTDLQAGDRVLVTAKAGDTGPSLTAARIVVMKSSAIAESHASAEAAWASGTGGLVKSVDPAQSSIVISNAARTVTVSTSANTVFRRYAGGSVRFEDATRSSLAAVAAGDQLRARGSRSADGSSLAADEIVSGNFQNYAGQIASIDAAANTVTLKDLTTKKLVTVALSAQSNLRRLPPEVAARFAARERAGGTGGAGGAGGTGGAGGASSARAGATGMGATGAAPVAAQTGSGASGAPGDSVRAVRTSAPGQAGGSGREGGTRGGGDLSAMVSRLPTETLSGLKPGEAVMIVASSAEGATGRSTAITLLAGVEPILSATPAGEGMTLSPWSVGGGGEGEGGASPQ